jgi:precorrin-6B methylase 2
MIEVNQSTLDYIRQHADEDVRQLALRGHKCPDVDLQYALEQIAGRQKARTKLPSWAAIDGIVYPPHLSMEQCSSEVTARYKASIAGKGALFVDLTAGFGVDMAFISQGFQKAVHVERQPQLCAISSENFRLLGLNHIEVVCGDGVAYLHTMRHADLLFIDPARRDVHGGRTYDISDCTPNVLEILDEMLEKADRVMIKLSPMLDWRKAVADLGKVNEVHIISVDNECKELLLILSKTMKPLRVFCVNNDECFEVVEGISSQPRPLPQDMRYLYEPNASVMKAGCFDLIEQRFGVVQLERNSHLFVSDKEISGFPGRQFLIEKRTSMNKRELKATLADVDQANITVRNFPMSVAELRKRLKLKEGGDVYIFATTISDEGHQLLVCRKKT